jgi:hypothetical protein
VHIQANHVLDYLERPFLAVESTSPYRPKSLRLVLGLREDGDTMKIMANLPHPGLALGTGWAHRLDRVYTLVQGRFEGQL